MPSPAGYAPNHEAALDEVAKARRYNEWLFSRASDRLGSRVLDLGAGVGTFTEMAAGRCELVVAVEPHPDFADLLRTRFAHRENVVVIEEDANRLERASPPSSLDAVICFNVLEHIADHESVLGQVHGLLRRDGLLFLLVPAHPFLYGSLDSAHGHERRYRKDDVGQLLMDAGFRIEDLRYVNPLGVLGWLVSSRLLKRTKFPSLSLRIYDRLVPALRLLDGLRLPVGLSVWAVARR